MFKVVERTDCRAALARTIGLSPDLLEGDAVLPALAWRPSDFAQVHRFDEASLAVFYLVQKSKDAFWNDRSGEVYFPFDGVKDAQLYQQIRSRFAWSTLVALQRGDLKIFDPLAATSGDAKPVGVYALSDDFPFLDDEALCISHAQGSLALYSEILAGKAFQLWCTVFTVDDLSLSRQQTDVLRKHLTIKDLRGGRLAGIVRAEVNPPDQKENPFSPV